MRAEVWEILIFLCFEKKNCIIFVKYLLSYWLFCIVQLEDGPVLWGRTGRADEKLALMQPYLQNSRKRDI